MNIFYLLLIRPVEYLFEIIFILLYRFTEDIPFSMMLLSAAVSILTLPMYMQSEKAAQGIREKKARIEKWKKHITGTFKGDERSLMLQAYYRIKGYHAYDELIAVLPLLLQIPFFSAAYHMLTNNTLLLNTSFMGIQDLAVPDGLIRLGTLQINVLPVLMTVISLVAGGIYNVGMTFKEKMVSLILPVFFLVLLYDSPAGLVIYWIGNNVFSLLKNVVIKYSKHLQIWYWITLLALPALFLGILLIGKGGYYNRIELFQMILSFVIILVLFVGVYKTEKSVFEDTQKNNLFWKKNGLLSGVILLVLLGAWIPLNLLAASPREFVIPGMMDDPRIYFYNTFFISIGFVVLHGGLIFYLLKGSKRNLFCFWAVTAAVTALVDFLFFGKWGQTIGANLVYVQELDVSQKSTWLNYIVALSVPVIILLLSKTGRILERILAVGLLCVLTMSIKELHEVSRSLSASKYSEGGGDYEKCLYLNRTYPNVVVIMLDRAISGYVPYMFEERRNLYDSFDGFVYYKNTLSFGGVTNVASHAAYGGYEYVPDAYTRKEGYTSKEVADEAQKVLPVLFEQNDFAVTMCDPPSTGEYENSRLYLYDDYPDIQAYNLMGSFVDKSIIAGSLDGVERNFFLYGVFRVLPESFAYYVYDEGAYLNNTRPENMLFMFSYAELDMLPEITGINDDPGGSFMYLYNLLPHEPTELQLPEYTPGDAVDNSMYADDPPNRFFDDDNYSVNMAAVLRLGEWFDWMRAEGVYDNTRIIVVADHGGPNGDFDEMKLMLSDGGYLDLEAYNPLLMYKDFDAKGFVASEEFMTNADVPWLAVRDLIRDPCNPFTRVRIDPEQKENTPIRISLLSGRPQICGGLEQSGASWYSLEGDMFDADAWKCHSGRD